MGFVLNRGLCGLYLPGTVIRSYAVAPDTTEREMATPIIFAWKEDCFPQQQYRQAPFFLPDTEGADTASFALGMDAADLLLPTLKVQRQTAVDYRLRFEGCRLITMAEVDLAHNFSDVCVKYLKDALLDGKKPEWFSVIVSAITADKLLLEVEWRNDASVQSRLAVRQLMEQALQRDALQQHQPRHTAMPVEVRLQSESRKKTTLSCTGNLIIGYRARPIQPVFSERQSVPDALPKTRNDPQEGLTGCTPPLIPPLTTASGGNHAALDGPWFALWPFYSI